MSAKRKRSAARMEKTVGADLEPVGNDLKFSIQISKNPESWLISNIFAVAKLTKSGENTSKSETPTQTCEIIEKEDDDNFDDDNDENEEDDDTEDGGDKVYKNLCENSVATLEATLITRGTTRNFHELCDMVSQEIQEAGTSLFDHHGKLYGPITKAVGKECNRGDFLYITSVEVKEPHRGKDIGISLCYAVMNALRDRYSLAVIFPAPLIHNPEILGVEKISRYFARAGFIQLCAGRPHSLNKYWVLESTKLPDTIKTKAEGSTIEVSKEPRNAKPEGVDKVVYSNNDVVSNYPYNSAVT